MCVSSCSEFMKQLDGVIALDDEMLFCCLQTRTFPQGGLLKPSCERLLNKLGLCGHKINEIRRLSSEILGVSKILHKLYFLVVFIKYLSLDDKEIICLYLRMFHNEQLADAVCVL